MKYIPKRLDETLTAGHWDVSIKLSLNVNGNLAFEEEMLLKASNDLLAVGYLRGKTRATSPDGWVLSVPLLMSSWTDLGSGVINSTNLNSTFSARVFDFLLLAEHDN